MDDRERLRITGELDRRIRSRLEDLLERHGGRWRGVGLVERDRILDDVIGDVLAECGGVVESLIVHDPDESTLPSEAAWEAETAALKRAAGLFQ